MIMPSQARLKEQLPLKQGLRPFGTLFFAFNTFSQRATSTKTRIKTLTNNPITLTDVSQRATSTKTRIKTLYLALIIYY